MTAVSQSRLVDLLEPYLGCLRTPQTLRATILKPEVIYPSLGQYLDLLLRWNNRTNLTSIRNAEQIVSRHFGESLFAGLQLAQRVEDGAAVLDFGSGAGFPGLPVQLLLPKVHVTLAESQGKKVAFLREAVRSLGISSAVWPGRVEEMPPELQFDAVMLRAVDDMARAVATARPWVRAGGWLMEMRVGASSVEPTARIPGLDHGYIHFEQVKG